MRLRATQLSSNAHGPLRTVAALVAAMFASTAAPAFDWSASDLSTQYQDSGGTLPVTAVEQPVGLVLDRAKGGAKRGPELCQNGGFDQDVLWTKDATWSISGGKAIKVAGSTGVIRQTGPLVAGRIYEISFDYFSVVGTFVAALRGGSAVGGSNVLTGTGRYRTLIIALTGNTTFDISGSTTDSAGQFDNYSIRELNGMNLWSGTPTSNAGSWTDNGDGSYSNTGNSGSLGWASGKLIIGRTYEVVGRVTARTAGSVNLPYDGNGGNAGSALSAPGTFRRVFTALATGLFIFCTSFTGTIDSLSVVEIPGNHLIQPTSASRPTLSARVNLLTYSEQISNAAWAKSASGIGTVPTVTDNFGVAPDGTTTAARVQLALNGGNTSGDISRLLQSITGMPLGGSYSQGLWLKTNDGTSKVIQFRDDNSGTVGKLITVTGTWQYFSQDSAVSGGSTTVNAIGLWLRGTQSTADSADLLMWHPQFNYGPLQRYQRIAAATDYDAIGFAKGWRFDGVDDGLYTPTVFDWSTTDKLTIVAALLKTSDVSLAAVAELGPAASTTNGTWLLCAPSGGASPSFGMFARGTVYRGVSPVGYPAPSRAIVFATADIAGARLTLSADGGVGQANASDLGTGNFTSQVLYVGRRTNSTVPFTGVIHSLRGFGRLVSPDERGWLMSQAKLDMNNNL